MRRSGHARLVGAVVAALLVALALEPVAGLAARPKPILVGSARMLSANYGRISPLCVGDKAEFGVMVVLAEEYRRADGSTFHLGRSTGQPETVTAESSDPSVASVSPATARQGKRLPTGGRGNFTVTAKMEGTTTVTFEDGNHIAAAVPIKIEVRPCRYEIEISSKWSVSMGFAVTMTQTVTRMALTRDPSGVEYFGSPDALNQATAPSIGGCTNLFDVARSLILIKFVEDPQRRGKLDVSLTYLPVKVTPSVCQTGGKPVEGTGSGTIANLAFRADLAASDMASRTFTQHVLTTERGSVKGNTTITIYRVPY